MSSVGVRCGFLWCGFFCCGFVGVFWGGLFCFFSPSVTEFLLVVWIAHIIVSVARHTLGIKN